MPKAASPEAPVNAQQLRTAIEILEAVVGDRGLLGQLSTDDRTRLIQAAGAVHMPDVHARRRLVKQKAKQRRADVVRRDDELLEETGIRELRRKPVFTTPNVFAPAGFLPHRRPADDHPAGSLRERRRSVS